MKLRPWAAFWVGVAVLAACDGDKGPMEQQGGDLDDRIEQTAKVASELEQAATSGQGE